MIWEINDDLSENELLLKYDFIDKKCIYWDFVLGSKYDLCAVFPWSGNETLQDFKKKGIRPVLYHKKLRTHHKINKATAPPCYILFPAVIQENILTIGNQKFGNVVYVNKLKDYIDVIIMRKRRKRIFFFFWKEYYSREEINLKINKNLNVIYYRLTENNNIYAVSIVEEKIYIYLQEKDQITFFEDRGCIRKLEKKL